MITLSSISLLVVVYILWSSMLLGRYICSCWHCNNGHGDLDVRCGHCQRLAPTWDELAAHFEKHSNVHISKLDCTVHSSTCQRQGVKGYPTLLLFVNGEQEGKYSGSRELEDLIEFVNRASVDSPQGNQRVKYYIIANFARSTRCVNATERCGGVGWWQLFSGHSKSWSHICQVLCSLVWPLQEAGPRLGPTSGHSSPNTFFSNHCQGKLSSFISRPWSCNQLPIMASRLTAPLVGQRTFARSKRCTVTPH